MSRKRIVGAVVILVSLPAALAFFEAVSFYARNRNNGSIVSSGQKREYLLYVPKSYDSAKPTPLVISLHGAGGWPVQQRDLSEWNRVADREGFIVVYPSGKTSAGPRVWHVGREKGLSPDVKFISDLIDKLAANYNIDRSRIYSNGMSNGGGMTFVLSCTLSDRIAAFGMVGAAQTLPWSWCTDRRAVPMIDFHGTADPMAFYNGGSSWVVPGLPGVATWAANWARRNRCAAKPVETAVAADVTRREYKNCADDAAVVLYTIRGGGHTWPGGQPMPEWFTGPTSRSIDASSVMWEFFRAHPLSTQNSGVGPRTILRLQTAAAVAKDAMNSSYGMPRGFDNHEQ
jgi:polyhydroxybutyrate depolymerase